MKLWRFALLSTLCFGFQGALLAYLPLAATRAGVGAFIVGLAVAVYVGIGIVFDSMIGRIVARIGIRTTILVGIAFATAGLGLLEGPVNNSTLLCAATLAGSAHAFQASPILSTLSLVIKGSQVRGQCINAMAQRGGALVASFSLLAMGSSASDLRRVLWILLIWLTLFCVTALSIGRGHGRRAPDRVPGSHGPNHGILRTVAQSASVRAGVSVSLSTGLVVIFGASFVPLILVALDRPELIVACLVAREACALVGAGLLWRVERRSWIARTWYATTLLGIAGAVMGTAVQPDWLVVVGFALHGLCLSEGIILGNVQIHDGTNGHTRIYGYAAQSIVSRTAGWASPIALNAAFVTSISTLLFAFGIGSGAVAALHAVLNSRQQRTASESPTLDSPEMTQ